MDFISKSYTTNSGIHLRAKIWDTAGQERFKTLTMSFYKRADGIILMFNTCIPRSFENIPEWIESIKQHANESVPVVLVGNQVDKSDLFIIQRDQAETLAGKYGMEYF